MNPETTQVDDLRLIALPSAKNCADLFVRFTLVEWRLRGLVDEVARVAGGLVGAAIRQDTKNAGFVTVRLRLRGDGLVVEVEDEQPGPRPTEPPHFEDLRGGVEPFRGAGRLLWCEVPLPTGQTASAVPLPQRERRPSAAAQRINEEEGEFDPQVWERLLAGLSRPSESGRE